MFQYVALTDGTTTIELTDGLSYALVSYAPGVAVLRDSELGSEGPYDTVLDTLTFHAFGCTAADAYAAAVAVNSLLDQARRWWLGENVSAVKLAIQAQDSALSPLQAAVKGRVPGGAPTLTLQPTWSEFHGKYLIQNITIQFQRRGQWIGADSAPAASASAAAPTIHSVTFADNQLISSPAKITIGGLANLASAFSGFLAITDSASDMVLVDAESMAFPANNWTSVADANARAGNILRWSQNTTAFVLSASAGTLPGARQYAVLATVRNNSATMSFLLRLAVTISVTGFSTPPVLIDTSTTNPRTILLGIVVLPEYTASLLHSFKIEAAQTAAGAGNSIDIDTLLVITLDDETSRVLAVPNFTLSAGGVNLIVNDQILTKPAPSVGDTAQVPPYYTSYAGDPLICSKGTAMAACLLATQGANWLVKNTTPATVQTNLTAVRHNAYLVPT